MKISRQTRETINTIAFLVVAALLVVIYIVYPLNRTKALMGREGIDNYDKDSIPAFDSTVWTETGLAPDTFHVESDGLTVLACIRLAPDSGATDSINGTVCLIHDDGGTCEDMIPLVKAFLDSGYVVVAYDQRASGRSTGKYRGEGQYEASDLQALISYLELRKRIIHPLLIAGYSLGADAAMLAAHEEKRINKVVAINPHLTTRRMQDILKKQHNAYWFPFYRTIMWWWYDIRSSYAAQYRDMDDLKAVACPTIIFMRPEVADDPEVKKIVELSDPSVLELKTTPTDHDQLLSEIITFIKAGK